MLLLPLLLFFPSLLKLMFAMQNSALYRYPTGDVANGKFKQNPFHYLWAEKVASSMVADQLDCTFLCVGEPKCYSFNMAAYPDSKGLYLCELLATDKYRATEKFHANATFHHYSPSVRFMDYNVTRFACFVLFFSIKFLLLFLPYTLQQWIDFKILYFQSPCESAPCKNGAVCVPEYERNSYHCDCKPGFCGTHCRGRGGLGTYHSTFFISEK